MYCLLRIVKRNINESGRTCTKQGGYGQMPHARSEICKKEEVQLAIKMKI